MKQIEAHRSFGGSQEIWEHQSAALACMMRFAIFLPSKAKTEPCPVVYWLSGLTCSSLNFTEKAGAQRYAEELGLILVMPDTSPRGEAVPDDEEYDLGQGAGFYLNATVEPWKDNYRMYDYAVEELPALVAEHFPVNGKRSIMGHSMGGYGALMIALKNPETYSAVSAFSPILRACEVPWGKKAFSAYLGPDEAQWKDWDVTSLIASSAFAGPISIEQGLSDPFLDKQLQTERFENLCKKIGREVAINYRKGYDHSYYFIASFIGGELQAHAQTLK